MSVGLRAIASNSYPGLDEVYVCAYSREEKDAVCDALDALENEAAPSEDADRRYAERLRAELDEERARERAANEARDAAYARSLQQDSARAPGGGRGPRRGLRVVATAGQRAPRGGGARRRVRTIIATAGRTGTFGR